MNFNIGKYTVELEVDPTNSLGSADSINHYQKLYITQSEYQSTTQVGLRVRENDILISSALIGAVGGGTGIHEHSQIIERDRIVICCSDSIFCLSIPELNLKWSTKADQITCFEIFKYQDSYIIHGELEISRLNLDGQIMWQQGGADIFLTLEGTDDFEVNDQFIRATDFNHRTYKFDFDGNTLE